MQAKVVHDGSGSRVVLQSGESFFVDTHSLPSSLVKGGDCQLVFVPAGEAVPETQARDLLNALLQNV
ncbi:hypothetical protein BK004_02445 [bacterium CG10_46_32]|nr:MAG: hypothetical protein BK004_02445 [bacterium CG10_46_32]PIR56170.1 MAG: hypothetical protein COU73_02465 [Parcubacteria group bacterium CG10_big_fil_rev_8_21_14_0_10_46_32]